MRENISSMKLFTTLKAKLAIALVCSTIVFGALISVMAYRVIQQEVADFSAKYLNTILVHQGEMVGTIFKDTMSFTQHIATQQSVIDYFKDPNAKIQDPNLLNYFAYSDPNKRYNSINLMDASGTDVVSTEPAAVNQNFKFRDYFKHAIEGTPFIEAAISAVTGKFGYYFSYPVKDANGNIVGIVAVKLKSEIVDAAVQSKILSANGATMLIDEYGVVIQSNNPELLYKSLGSLTPAAQQTITETRKFANIPITPLPYKESGITLEAAKGQRIFSTYDDLHKQNEIVGIAQIDTLPFFVVIEESTQSFADIARKVARLIILSTVTAGGVGLVLLWLLIVRLLRPLNTLKNAAIRVSKGDLDELVPVTTQDEFGALGDAFNLMTEHLKDFYNNLEGKVWERTADFEKYKLAVESASDLIVITDIDGRILYANKAATDITGYTQNELIGNRPTIWGRQMPQAFYELMWCTIKEDKKPFYGEVVNKRKTGEKYTAEVHISPLFMNKKSLYGFVGIERDVTAHEEVDKAKTEFVSIASHQLRTPLAVINWYIEMLTSEEVGKVNESQRKYLDQIYLASKRMVDLVNSLLSVSRIDMNTYYVEPEPLDFRIVADSILEELSKSIKKKNLHIEKEYDLKLPLVDADPSLLRVIFQNLLSNAVKYTADEGSIGIAIKKSEGVDILITVTDTGYGIPLQQQKHIFQKFFRADNAREKEPDGNGLGLYIVKSIVEHASGTIWFTSTENKGTTFYVKLPLAGMKKNEGAKPLEL